MEIEFDPKKRDWTLRHRALDFADARFLFTGQEVTFADVRRSYGESRYLTFGRLGDLQVVIAWTPRVRGGEVVCRIISMRRANEKEIAALRE